MGSTLKKVAAASALALASFGTGAANAQSSFDGFYLGAFIQNDFGKAPGTGLDGAVGIWAGYNYSMSNGFVLGAEADLQYDWATSVVTPTGSAFSGLLNARAGYAPTQDFMFYGKGGAGFMSSGVGFIYDFGAGAEYKLGQKTSIRGEVMRVMGAGMARSRTDFKLGVGYSF